MPQIAADYRSMNEVHSEASIDRSVKKFCSVTAACHEFECRYPITVGIFLALSNQDDVYECQQTQMLLFLFRRRYDLDMTMYLTKCELRVL